MLCRLCGLFLGEECACGSVICAAVAARVGAVAGGFVAGDEGELSVASATRRRGAAWSTHPCLLGLPPGPQVALEAVGPGTVSE